jgi:hypothetical protein
MLRPTTYQNRLKKLYFAVLSHQRSLIKTPFSYLSDSFRARILGNKSPQCPGPMAQALSKDDYPLPLSPVLLSKHVPMFKAARILVGTYCYQE